MSSESAETAGAASESTLPVSGVQRGRGRPSIVDAMAIAEAALVLWDEQGYANTGWKEISEATGVSVRTLMRHFTSRANLAWYGVLPATDRMAESAHTIHPEMPLGLALRTMIQASVSRDPKVDVLGPSWIKLVADEPEIAMLSPSGHNPWILQVASFIASRRPDLPDAITTAIAIAYQSVTFAALTDWARSSPRGDAADTVDALLLHLDPLIT